MTDLVTTFRAAKMAGVSRSEFQKKIHSGELKTFEGNIHLTDLQKVFPNVRKDLKADAAIERMESIKKAASYGSKKARSTHLPDAQIVMTHLEALSHKSLEIKASLESREALLEVISERLEQICDKDEDCLKHEIEVLLEWLHAETSRNP